jgi:hypothetical protein
MLKALYLFIVGRLLSASSFLMVVVFYFMCIDVPVVYLPCSLGKYIFVKTFIMIIIVMFFAWFLIWLVKKTIRTEDSIEIVRIRPIESVAMPTYMGLFVISLGITTFPIKVAGMVLIILFIFWGFFERVFYFNPIWIIFGYRFYEAESKHTNTFTLITKQRDLKNKLRIDKLRRINNYTFMEIE